MMTNSGSLSGSQIRAAVAMRFPAHSDLQLDLITRFPGFRPDPLGAIAEKLNEEKEEVYVIPSGGDSDAFVLASPRLRLRCIGDLSSRAVTVLNVDTNELQRWRRERRSNYALRVEACWSARQDSAEGAKRLFELIRDSKSRRADSGDFWQYWREYLDVEQGRIDEVRNHPGWSYHERRWGLGRSNSGCFDFRVDDDQEQVLATCDNRVLISIRNDDGEGMRVVPLELLTPAGPRWISAAPVDRSVRIDQIPKEGRIQPDWKSLLTEYRRRRDALDMLVRGETALPELNQILPEGQQTAANRVPFSPVLPYQYNNEQQLAIQAALAPNTLCCILGPPGTGKTSVIAEIASQVAGRGGRVLISSQSNLAVDNALERVVDSDSVFRVRLGRPESVRLNPELLLDRASDRYRESALRRSEAALVEQIAILECNAEMPTSTEVEQIVRRADVIARARSRILDVTSAIDKAEQERESAETAMQRASAEFDKKLAAVALTIEQVSRLSAVMKELHARGWSALRLRKDYSLLQRRLVAEPALEALERAIQKLNVVSSRGRAAASRINMLAIAIRTRGLSADLRQEKIAAAAALELAQSELAHAKGEVARTFAESGLGTLDNLAIQQARADVDTAKYVQGTVGWPALVSFVNNSKLTTASDAVVKHVAALEDIHQAVKQHRASLAQLQADIAMAGEHECRAALVAVARKLRLPGPPAGSGNRLAEWITQLRAVYRKRIQQQSRAMAITDALRAYHERLRSPNADVQRAVLAEANVVAATCSGIAGAADFAGSFDYVIVDEAGKASPLELLIPIVRGKTVILVGDHKQLPPLLDREITDELIASGASQRTLFERLFACAHPTRRQSLRLQYRMVPVISDVVSELSYRDDPLEPAGQALTRQHPFDGLGAIHWIQCEGEHNRAERVGHGIRNRLEASAAAAMVQRIAERLRGRSLAEPYTLGVISMYRQQVIEIERLLPKELLELDYLRVEIGTVDAFQGREKDAVIVSFVETDPRPVRFFYDRRRLNVALSRSRELLVVIGSLEKLRLRRGIGSEENPVRQLYELIQQSALRQCATTEVFHEQ